MKLKKVSLGRMASAPIKPVPKDQILISKFLVGRKTGEVVENADESGFGEGEGAGDSLKAARSFGLKPRRKAAAIWSRSISWSMANRAPWSEANEN